MKMISVLLAILLQILGFSASAFSTSGICTGCAGGETLRAVPCVGGSSGCTAFDFDLNALNHDGSELEDGYCGAPSTGNYRAIAKIYECPYPELKFFPGKIISIRMTILVNGAAGDNGAYWSGPAITSPGIAFEAFASESAACDADIAQSRSFGVPAYYLSNMTVAIALTEDPDCVVPAANKATILNAPGYTIDESMYLNMLNRWWIDIPPVRIDPNIIARGDVISIKIEILYDNGSSMVPWLFCDGEIDIAVAGCKNPNIPGLMLLLGD